MVCENCRINLDRINMGYSALDLPCSCSVRQNFFFKIKQLISGVIVAPFLFGVTIFLFPIVLGERVVCWLEKP